MVTKKREIRDDFDSPWKDEIEWYLEECMAFFFPQAHADIDWSRGYEFLDKELQRITRDATLGRWARTSLCGFSCRATTHYA
jgi:hypothetical protein